MKEGRNEERKAERKQEERQKTFSPPVFKGRREGTKQGGKKGEKKGARRKKARMFLVADTQLYERLCPSPRLSIHQSIGLLVHWSVRPSVMIESKSGKTSVLDPFCVCLCGRGMGLGLEGGWRLLPTCPQRYCD